MAHKIKHLFQYQEEKQQQHSDNWDDPGVFAKKQSLLPTPSSIQPRPHGDMDEAELSYYEHKSKLKKTQVTHRPVVEEWQGEESLGGRDEATQGDKTDASLGHPPHKYNRAPQERPGELRVELLLMV